MNKICRSLVIILGIGCLAANAATQNFTVINEYNYEAVVQQSQADINKLINTLKPHQNDPDYINQVIVQAISFFKDRPYNPIGIEGEGDWYPGGMTRRGLAHIQQDPVYRTDRFVCNTLVQVILGLLHANNIDEYNKNALTINYGAANEPPSHINFYNRNNFASVDFNRVNQNNGLIEDVTASGVFANFVKVNTSIIDRQAWFNHKFTPENIGKNVRVLDAHNGPAMVNRAANGYPQPYHLFKPVQSTLAYIPKEALINKTSSGTYQPNEDLLQQLPTPAIVEIVRDPNKWRIGGKLVTATNGSNIDISHLGFIHRAFFKQGQLIHQQISCEFVNHQKICRVKPIYCTTPGGCYKIMFDHATDAHPSGYYYTYNQQGQPYCTSVIANAMQKFTACNRVVSIPLDDYLLSYNYGQYGYMSDDSLLGINVQKINNIAPYKNFK